MSCLVAHEEKEGGHRMRIWMKKYTKRFLCQKFFLFLLIALPFFTYLYSYAVHQKSTKVKVGIVADKDNVFVREIQEELLSKTGMITFCEISSEKDMIQKVRIVQCNPQASVFRTRGTRCLSPPLSQSEKRHFLHCGIA